MSKSIKLKHMKDCFCLIQLTIKGFDELLIWFVGGVYTW